jgi:hypothetical protein
MRVKNVVTTCLAAGIARDEARRLIGCVIAAEILAVMKTKTPFDRKRFVEWLDQLPAMPWAEEKAE